MKKVIVCAEASAVHLKKVIVDFLAKEGYDLVAKPKPGVVPPESSSENPPPDEPEKPDQPDKPDQPNQPDQPEEPKPP